jgi:hypothetical protein
MARTPVNKRNADKLIFIGKQAHPVAVIKRKEIAGYLTEELSEMYTVWSRFNSGLGLPHSQSWNDYPERFVAILGLFINAWEEAKR